MNNQAKYIWFNQDDTSRNPYAAFRKTFGIKNASGITEAKFNIFADTNYALYVNGNFVGFGPVRFDPRYPQYDTYDLTQYLSDGQNAIAVLVNFQGHKVYKTIPMRAAMIGWGKISGGGEKIDLTTNQDGWKCVRHTAYDRFTPKLSFALFAQTHYDQARFDEAWINTGYDDSNWANAAELADQNCFGELLPREIPFMRLTEIPVAADTRIFPHVRDEDWHTFTMEAASFTDSHFANQYKPYYNGAAWSTYIYSPCDQIVTSGVVWEHIWVNGAYMNKTEDNAKPLRNNFAMPLNKGWNYIFGSTSFYQDILDFYLPLPKNKGLVVSVDKKLKGGRLFRRTKLIPIEQAEAFKAVANPWAEDINIDNFGGWTYTTEADAAENPCREGSYDTYGAEFERLAPGSADGFTVRKSAYPDGFTLLFNMDQMRLVFPRFDLSGVNGATIDLLYADRLSGDGKHVNQFSWVPLGDRIVCGCDNLNWLPIQPRGFVYLAVCIRNASGDVKINKIDFLSAHYPAERIGKFECSDVLLNRIWEMGAVSQAVNMEDAYVDCVDRERGLYALDTQSQYHSNLACFGDHKLMKRCMELYAQAEHPSGMLKGLYPNTGDYILQFFSLFIVDMFGSYYKYTGDKEFIKTWWKNIMTNIGAFSKIADERDDKLLCMSKRPPNQQPQKPAGKQSRSGNSYSHGVSAMFSNLYLLALRNAVFMAGEIGETSGVQDMNERIAILEKSIPATFWDSEKMAFSDDSEKEYFTVHGSLYPLIAGSVPDDIMPVLLKNLKKIILPFFDNGYDPKDGYAFNPPYGHYFLDILYKAGLADVAESCIKEGWGWMLAQGLKTTTEHFTTRDSRCHAWGANPTYVLSRHVLGINYDVTTGLNNIIIDIKPGSVEWAKGVFPHHLGGIEIEWRKDKETGKIIVDSVVVPAGVTYTVK
jgi:hypothetical protein